MDTVLPDQIVRNREGGMVVWSGALCPVRVVGTGPLKMTFLSSKLNFHFDLQKVFWGVHKMLRALVLLQCILLGSQYTLESLQI